jgi:hypothetical protein
LRHAQHILAILGAFAFRQVMALCGMGFSDHLMPQRVAEVALRHRLQVAQYGVLKRVRDHKLIPSTSDIFLDALDAFPNVMQIDCSGQAPHCRDTRRLQVAECRYQKCTTTLAPSQIGLLTCSRRILLRACGVFTPMSPGLSGTRECVVESIRAEH